MKQLFDQDGATSAVAAVLDRSDRQAPSGRPWVMANMVASADGAYAISGVSRALSSPEDREIFHALRASADAVLVAAGTARAERYRRPTAMAEFADQRRVFTPTSAPRLVVVSRSLRLAEDQPFLSGEGVEPLLLHPADADTSGVPAGVELRGLGSGGVDLQAAMRSLYADGVRIVLCEGGPTLLGQLHELDLIDELFLSLAPILASGTQVGILGGGTETIRQLSLHRVWEANGFLFLNYRRDRQEQPASPEQPVN